MWPSNIWHVVAYYVSYVYLQARESLSSWQQHKLQFKTWKKTITGFTSENSSIVTAHQIPGAATFSPVVSNTTIPLRPYYTSATAILDHGMCYYDQEYPAVGSAHTQSNQMIVSIGGPLISLNVFIFTVNLAYTFSCYVARGLRKTWNYAREAVRQHVSVYVTTEGRITVNDTEKGVPPASVPECSLLETVCTVGPELSSKQVLALWCISVALIEGLQEDLAVGGPFVLL